MNLSMGRFVHLGHEKTILLDKTGLLLLMDEMLHQQTSHYSRGFIHRQVVQDFFHQQYGRFFLKKIGPKSLRPKTEDVTMGGGSEIPFQVL